MNSIEKMNSERYSLFFTVQGLESVRLHKLMGKKSIKGY